jgi:hypothetical protein
MLETVGRPDNLVSYESTGIEEIRTQPHTHPPGHKTDTSVTSSGSVEAGFSLLNKLHLGSACHATRDLVYSPPS